MNIENIENMSGWFNALSFPFVNVNFDKKKAVKADGKETNFEHWKNVLVNEYVPVEMNEAWTKLVPKEWDKSKPFTFRNGSSGVAYSKYSEEDIDHEKKIIHSWRRETGFEYDSGWYKHDLDIRSLKEGCFNRYVF